MKLLFVSDIHGSLYYAKKCIERFNQEGADQIISLGDLMYHGPRNPLPKDYAPKEVANLLNQYKDKIISVRGNCDSEVDQMLLEFPILSDYSILYIDGYRFFITHGHHYDEDHLPSLSKNDVLIYGHYHVPIAKKKEDIYIFNPSSISLPKASVNSYGVYENKTFYIKDLDGNVLETLELE